MPEMESHLDYVQNHASSNRTKASNQERNKNLKVQNVAHYLSNIGHLNQRICKKESFYDANTLHAASNFQIFICTVK